MELTFYLPTKIIMGKNCINQNAKLFSKTGKSALVISYSVNEKNGSIDDVKKALEDQGIKYVITLDAPINPELEQMKQFGDMAASAGAEMIIGIGGGSVLDTAKAAAVLAVNDIPVEKLYSNVFENRPLPVICIPTTAGTGSEVTPYSVLTIRKTNIKKSFGSEDFMSPVYAFLDARYTETMPPQVAADSSIDALSHGLEGFLSTKSNWVSDMIGMTIFSNFHDCISALQSGVYSFEEREKLLFNASLSGIMINHMRTLAVHAMGYPLSVNRKISHGAACGVLFGAFMEYIYQDCKQKADKMYQALGVKDTDGFSKLIASILKFKGDFSIEELEKFTEESYEAAAAKNNPRPVDRPAVLEMFKRALL